MKVPAGRACDPGVQSGRPGQLGCLTSLLSNLIRKCWSEPASRGHCLGLVLAGLLYICIYVYISDCGAGSGVLVLYKSLVLSWNLTAGLQWSGCLCGGDAATFVHMLESAHRA